MAQFPFFRQLQEIQKVWFFQKAALRPGTQLASVVAATPWQMVPDGARRSNVVMSTGKINWLVVE